MEVSRAKEILNSEQTIRVEYQGIPVWIDQINENNQTVILHRLGAEHERQTVNAAELIERH